MDIFEKYCILTFVSCLLIYEIYKYHKGYGIGKRVFIFVKPKNTNIINRTSLFLLIVGLTIIEFLLILFIIKTT
ncbi:hypothetical protein CO168_01400 [Candidatus Shapirobacteria bacterium CG_4_9_14_3_um_filter_36_12]|uniref:Uncharacterized protein n=1 Tax=Candidatus Shapirobacteria bacterium CG_4_9_14_3_um_filter_36_12 TaxID=1974877 RepID=A0A2M7XNI7_9BACT|nr:MAG: hypothetical protein CO168_01400 [Candidatus Shapirobacteria bacterium CG_4_9_14_3_um_filter_36_12]